MDSEWLPCSGVSLENELSSDFDLGEQQQEQQDARPSTEPKRPRLSLSLKKRERGTNKPEEDKHEDPEDDENVFKDSTNTHRFGS